MGGRCHGSGCLFLVEKHRQLPVPLKMSGQHKLWRLDRRLAADAFKGLLDTERLPPLRFMSLRQEVQTTQQLAESGSDLDSEEVDACLLNLVVQHSLGECERLEDVSGSDSELLEAIRLSIQEGQGISATTAVVEESSKSSVANVIGPCQTHLCSQDPSDSGKGDQA